MIKFFVNGFVGNTGTKILIENKKDILVSRFSINYLEKVMCDIKDGFNPSLFNFYKDLDNFVLIDKEEIGRGGFLASLWKICERNKWGLCYNLSKVPILQGTIEICEFFDLNPYRLFTKDAYIYAYEEENYCNNEIDTNIDDKIVEENSIAYVTKNKKRVRIDGEVESFLIKDFKDEIDKVIK